MPAKRYRYIGDAPTVHVPDMHWGDLNDPELSVHPGDVSELYDGEISSGVIVEVGSKEEQDWLTVHRPDEVAKTKGGKS